jgi:alpha-galactosidase
MSTVAEKQQGHAAHTKAADNQLGLQGTMPRPIVITMMGAGSGFTPTLMKDVLCIPTAEAGEIRLCDVDESRLATMHKVISKLVEASGRTGWTVKASKNRRELLPGSDYVVNCIEVSGLACVRHDNDIPLKYGVDQCIGDTIGPGGLFKGLRTVPVYLEILRDMRELCPRAIMLNYTNPMNMMCLAAGRAVPEVQTVGLCHSVQGTSHLLAGYAGIPYGEMEWACAGINHLAWFTKLEHKGKDLYTGVLYEKFRQELATAAREAEEGKASHQSPDIYSWGEKRDLPYTVTDVVRKDMCVQFGAFITESSGHLSEYLPYYRKRKDLLSRYARLFYDGGSSFYADNWPTWRKNADEKRERMVRGDEPLPKFERSWEYASWIIEAREKDQPFRIHGNVMNVDRKRGGGPLIGNLHHDGCVEVSCMVDKNGVQPTRYGDLPPQMAAVCESNMRMFDLAAKAVIEKSKEAAAYALMLDPLTAACCSPAEARQMTMELFDAEKEFLPGYR